MTDEELYQMATDHASDIAQDVQRDYPQVKPERVVQLARRTLLDFAELVRKDEFVERWKPSRT